MYNMDVNWKARWQKRGPYAGRTRDANISIEIKVKFSNFTFKTMRPTCQSGNAFISLKTYQRCKLIKSITVKICI